MSEHYRIIIHSPPELVTTVAGSAGGVGEDEWFGGAAMNSCCLICMGNTTFA